MGGALANRLAESTNVGLLVPATNKVMEQEFHMMALGRAMVHTARMLHRGALPTDDLGDLVVRLRDDLPDAVSRLTPASPDVVLFGCTSGGFMRGVRADSDIINEIEGLCEVPTTTASQAVTRALRAMMVRRVGVLTPYPDDVNAQLVRYLEHHGISVVGVDRVPYASAQSDSAAYTILKTAERANADGFLISCTDFKAVAALDWLESQVERPVISSNQASFWSCLRLTSNDLRFEGWGSLFVEA